MNTASFNKGESNSILQPKLHLQQHPEVVFRWRRNVDINQLRFHYNLSQTLMKKVQLPRHGRTRLRRRSY
jgi:hypothetical protein